MQSVNKKASKSRDVDLRDELRSAAIVDNLSKTVEELSKSKENLEGLVEMQAAKMSQKDEELKRSEEAVKSLSAQVTAFQVENKRLLEKVEQSQGNNVALSNLVSGLQRKIAALEKALSVTQKPGQYLNKPFQAGEEKTIVKSESLPSGTDSPKGVDEVESEDVDSLVDELREKLVSVKAERAEANGRAEILSREVCKLQAKLAPWDAGDSIVFSRSRSLWRELDDTQKELSQLKAERDFLARKIKAIETDEEWDRPTLLKRMFPFWDTCRSSWVQ